MPHLSNSSGPPEPPGPPDSGRGTASGRRGTAERRLASAQHTIAWSMPPAVSGAGRAVTRPAAARKHLCLIVVCVRACACLRVLGRTPRWRWAWWRWAWWRWAWWRWGWWRQVLSSLGLVYRATDKAPCFYPTQAPRAVGGWGGVGLTWPQTATAPLVDGRPLTGQSSSGAAASPRPMRAEARRAERV